MNGRYGPDELYAFLFKLYILIFVINLFLSVMILTYLEFIIVCIIFYRFFSKKIYKRSNENKMFLKFKNRISKYFVNIRRNFSDKHHVYRRCFKCKTTLKLPLPSKRGCKRAVCPKCGKSILIFTLKKEKIEIKKAVYKKKSR